MKKLLYIASIILLIGCLDEDAFESPAVAFYPEHFSFAKETDGKSLTIQLKTTDIPSVASQIKISISNAEYLEFQPAQQGGVVTLDLDPGQTETSFTVKVLDDDITESYESIFMISSVSGGIKSAAGSNYTLYVENTDVVFNESFNDCSSINFTSINEVGAQTWGCASSGMTGSGYGINGYESGARVNIDWLVSNQIDLSNVTSAYLSFYSDVVDATTESRVELYVSNSNITDFTQITATDWKQFAADFDTKGARASWTSSGRINLNDYLGGSVYVAFKYISTNNGAANWTIDDVKIEAFDPTYVAPLSALSEDFETSSTTGNLSIENWDNIAQEGTVKWKVRETDGNKYAQMEGANSNEDANIGWLITPKIDFSSLSTKTMNFNSQIRLADDALLQLYYSKNFNGNVISATWTELTYTKAEALDGESSGWVNSGDISLSGITGSGYIGFKYVGSGNLANLDGQIQLDDIVIGGGNVGSADFIFFDDFEDCTTDYEIPSNFIEAIVAGAKTDRGWGCRAFGEGGGRAPRASAFGGADGMDNAWLITASKINLSSVSTAFLSMDINSAFPGDGDLKAHWSENYSGSGDPTSANWTELSDFTSQLPTKGTGAYSFVVSDMTAAAGKQVYIAIQYVGGLSSGSSSYDIDNFMVSKDRPTEVIEPVNDIAIPFTDDFEGCTDNYATPSNFVEVFVAGSKTDRGWGCREFGVGNTRAVRASAFGGADGTDNAWLVTNGKVDLSGVTSATFSADIKSTYPGLGDLKALWSENYTGSGDPSSATWTELTDFSGQLPVKGSDAYTTITSDLSGAAGKKVYVALQYSGGTSGDSASYDVDNYSITGN